jgi:hypothetical protein
MLVNSKDTVCILNRNVQVIYYSAGAMPVLMVPFAITAFFCAGMLKVASEYPGGLGNALPVLIPGVALCYGLFKLSFKQYDVNKKWVIRSPRL